LGNYIKKKIFFGVILLCVIAFSISSVSATVTEWDDGLNTGLSAYWTWNETSGTTATDSIYDRTISTINGHQTSSGKIGYGYDVNAEGRDDSVDITEVEGSGKDGFTMNFWMNPDAQWDSYKGLAYNVEGYGGSKWWNFFGYSNYKWNFNSQDGLINNIDYPTGQFSMVTLTINSTNNCMWMNATLMGCNGGTWTDEFVSTETSFFPFSRAHENKQVLNTVYDELFLE